MVFGVPFVTKDQMPLTLSPTHMSIRSPRWSEFVILEKKIGFEDRAWGS